MDDSRIVDSLDRKDQSLGTGGNDHAVRLLFFDKLRSYLTVHHDLNAILLAAMDVAADHVCDVTFSRRICSKSHVSAENISCLIKCYLMASLFAINAAESPATPPPITITFFGSSAFSSGSAS